MKKATSKKCFYEHSDSALLYCTVHIKNLNNSEGATVTIKP